jgi:hypothetical protein
MLVPRFKNGDLSTWNTPFPVSGALAVHGGFRALAHDLHNAYRIISAAGGAWSYLAMVLCAAL